MLKYLLFSWYIDINNCIDAYAYGFRKNHENLKMSAFKFISCKYRSEMLVQKMSKTHPKEHEDYQNEIKEMENAVERSQSNFKRSGFLNLMTLSPELAAIVGERFGVSRAECTKALWIYLKKNNLQDPENRQFFIPDRKLAKIYGNDKIRFDKMAKYLEDHLS